MVTQVRKWGNSLAVRLPRGVAEAADLRAGSSVNLAARRGEVVVSAVRVKRYRLADLVRGMRAKNRHPLLLEGPARGREIW